MSFNSDGLQVAGDNSTIGSGPGSIRRLWFYVTEDTKAQVETDGYFDAIAARMNTGDVIIVSFDVDGTVGTRTYAVTATTGDIALTAAATT